MEDRAGLGMIRAMQNTAAKVLVIDVTKRELQMALVRAQMSETMTPTHAASTGYQCRAYRPRELKSQGRGRYAAASDK